MYEPPHWTKPRLAPIAKVREPADAPAKPHTSLSIEDLAESIKTLKDGMRAMAEQVAGLTARVDDLAEYLRPLRDAAALDAIDTGPGGCAKAIAEQERRYAEGRRRADMLAGYEPLTPPDRVKQYERLGYRQMIIDHEGGEPFAWVHEGNGCWSRDGLMEAAIREGRHPDLDYCVRLPNDFLSKMEEDAASGRVRTWAAATAERGELASNTRWIGTRCASEGCRCPNPSGYCVDCDKQF